MTVTNVNLRAGWERERQGDLSGAQTHYQAWTAAGTDTGEGWFRLGIVCIKQGKFEEAMAALNSALELRFKPAESYNLLGVAQAGTGKPELAEVSFRAALAIAPRFVDAWVNLGRALLEQSKLDEALVTLQHALQLDPNRIAAWENLASVHLRQGRSSAAMEALQYVLKLQPRQVSAIVALSELFAHQGRLAEAARGFELARQLAPLRADVEVGLGVVRTQQQQLPAAINHFKRATELDSRSSAAFSNLGNAYRELGDLDTAERCLDRALAIAPQNVHALANMGTLCLDRREFEAAESYFRRALELDPQSTDASIGIASLHTHATDFQAAQAILQQVVDRHPQMVQAQVNLAALELLMGQWTQGFQRYEWRWRLPTACQPDFAQPAWDGSVQPNKTLLLHCEQGMGDTLQFCRFAQMAKLRLGRVVLAAPRALHQLLSRTPGIDALVTPEEPPSDFDFHLSLMSLARVFRITPATVPVPIPYIHADPERIKQWQSRLPVSREEFRVGLVWRGNPKYRGDRERSLELERFQPLARLPGVRLYALQKEAVAHEISRLADRLAVVDLAAELDNDGHAFVDTAAVMQQLDLVVSVDSAPAHLAGAMGVPVWLMLPHVAHWPWLIDREDNLWYPQTRIFRQPAAGDWETVLNRLTSQLAQLLASRN